MNDPATTDTGVLLVNFGEPEEPTPEQVVPFLERIFLANAALEPGRTEEEARRRSRELAERRAPGLIEEYEAIGGSPLNRQADAQALALERELVRRGRPARVYSAFQFTPPSVVEAVESARADGVRRLVGLPVYPLCGTSTNLAALSEIQAATEALGWSDVELDGISGWHRHPGYLRLRAEAVERTASAAGLSLADEGVRLVFSAHGTPRRYLEEGSRYDEYVEEFCSDLARALGGAEYLIGYQNHRNRGVAWTEPDVEEVIERIDGRAVIVEAVSFMHEQSETLAELDIELREEAEARGLAFHRVPIPHDDPRFAEVLADLVEGQAAGAGPGRPRYAQCRCLPRPGVRCLNALPRE